METTVQRIDYLKEIELASNLTEKQLENSCSLKLDEAKKIKQRISEIKNMSDEELKLKYELSDANLRILRKATAQKEDYKPYKEVTESLSLSTTIGSSYLTFTEGVYNDSTSKVPNYKVLLHFNWDKCYWNNTFSDCVAVAWGGSFNKVANSSAAYKYVKYYNVYGVYPAYTWGKSIVGEKSPSATEVPQNGVKYYFPQVYSSSASNIADAKYGYIKLELSKGKFDGNYTNIVSQYCHRVISTSGASISFSGPSIDASSAYETTDTDKTSISVRY